MQTNDTDITLRDLDFIRGMMNGAILEIAEKFGNGKTGGYLFLCDSKGELLLHEPLGVVRAEKDAKYKSFSREKAERLSTHHKHLTSYQSRNPENDQWGGAILLQNGCFLSFSGFPELVDEALCIAGGRIAEMVDSSYAEELASFSDNTGLYKKIYTLMYTALKDEAYGKDWKGLGQ